MSPTTRSNVTKSDHVSDLHQLSDEGEMIVSRLTDKIDEIYTKFESIILEKDKRIECLENELVTVKKNLLQVVEKVDDADAYERRDTVVLSGNLPVYKTGENCSAIAQQLFKDKLKVILNSSDVSVAHRLGRKPDTQRSDKRSIIVKLCRRDLKHDILSAAKANKPHDFFVNENLTPKRSTLLYALRQAKKKFPSQISGCNSREGKVFVYIKPSNPDSSARNSKMSVNTLDSLEEFCSKILNKPVSCLIDRWPHD